MMMDTAVKQQADSNSQALVTPTERHTLLQKLISRCPLEISKQIENQAYEKSHGIRLDYFKLIQAYFQRFQTMYQNHAGQQQQNGNGQLPSTQTTVNQQSAAPSVTQVQQPLNQMLNQPPRFPVAQQAPRMLTPAPGPSNQMTRLREPAKLNLTPSNTLSYSHSPSSTTTTTIDLSQGYSSQQITLPNQNDYSTLQPRYPIAPAGNVPRPRMIVANNNFQHQQPSATNANDILHQYVVGNSPSISMSTAAAAGNASNSPNNDQLLHRMLLSNIDGGANKQSTLTRQATAPVLSQTIRPTNTLNSNLTNNSNPLRSSLSSQQLSPAPSVAIIATPTQTSTVQIQPSSNITIQQSPLNNSNGPFSANSQTLSTNSSTPILINHSSPTTRMLPGTAIGNISSPDDETQSLIKYLKENVHRLQILYQKFTNEGNTDKVRQVQLIQQQIVQFVNNPTYETLANAKHFRDMLDRLQARTQPVNPTNVQSNLFTQCQKATSDFLTRDHKERINVTKRYLEPLSDVINGVPHKMMRLDDDDHCGTVKVRTFYRSSLLSTVNDELNQLPDDMFSIECMPVTRTRKTADQDQEYLSKHSVVLRCKLLEKSHPMIPPLRLHVTTLYPEQPPEVSSLTKTMPPRLEFTDGHAFFDRISSLFVSRLFKLPAQHTITDILNIWRISIHTAS